MKLKILKINNFFFAAIMLCFISLAYGHPTGNMIVVGENVLWSYINPINDPNHYACVMIWEKGAEPKVLIQSEYPSSDYMLYNHQNEIYVVERKFSRSTDNFEVRVLKTTIEKKPEVIWDWFRDDYRIGEGGFFMLSDWEMVFGKYPEIYSMKKGKKPTKYFEFNHPVKRIRAVTNNHILMLGESSCYLVKQNGTILKQWNELIDNGVENAPLNRNQIFDVDYSNGELLLSYWGKRSFDLINSGGTHRVILEQTEPLTPHWVAFVENAKLLFSSRLVFDNSMPKPHLVFLNERDDKTVLWSLP